MTGIRALLVLSHSPLIVLLSASWLIAQQPGTLSIRQNQYPRAFFFRTTEQAFNARRYPTYESWDAQFNRLQGIMGKCLEEECLGREPRNAEFFNRFKQQHPEQVVLLHFNGNARDPRYHTESYFPGHWIYREAIAITRDVPAEAGESVIYLEDVRNLRVNAGRYRTSNDDIALFGLRADGRHDWLHCEQVQLISIDQQAKTIRVRRGCYGTSPLAFRAGKARAAAHQVEGPWGRNNHLMWYYNFSEFCPRDAKGRTSRDLLVEDLANWFDKDGILHAFDGLEFDVMFNQTHGDTDGDGLEDDGVIDGVNQYGIGVVHFARQLRERMGDDFVIQGDGALGPGGSRSQRAWGILNGIESEGWPNLNDWEFQDWSGGMNRHYFWRENARQPVFNYVNHKWVEPVPGQPGEHKNPQVPWSRHRLALAACQFFDAATCFSFAPPNDPDGRYGIWDELRCGTATELAWLGRAEGPAIRLATRRPNLLAGGGTGTELAGRISGPVRTTATDTGVLVIPRRTMPGTCGSACRGVPTGPSGDSNLFLQVVMQGEPRRGYPREMARYARIGVAGGMIDLLATEPIATGMKLRGADQEVSIDRETGASLQLRNTTIDGTAMRGYFLHPPYLGSKGYVFWEQEVDVPPGSQLSFSIGMGPLSPERSDGVQFEVRAAVVQDAQPGRYTTLFKQVTNQHKWLPQTVSLRSYAGQCIRLKFIADCGPRDNATTDHANWGGVCVVREGENVPITEMVDFMTWVNDQPFSSSYFFQHVKTPEVDVTFDVEGGEPILLHSVTAYAHADAVCRIFERGLVLANPSHAPYVFDLEELSPGRRYRRIQGSANQDTETNNGRRVGNTVVLGERDGLFLQRIE